METFKITNWTHLHVTLMWTSCMTLQEDVAQWTVETEILYEDIIRSQLLLRGVSNGVWDYSLSTSWQPDHSLTVIRINTKLFSPSVNRSKTHVWLSSVNHDSESQLKMIGVESWPTWYENRWLVKYRGVKYRLYPTIYILYSLSKLGPIYEVTMNTFRS